MTRLKFHCLFGILALSVVLISPTACAPESQAHADRPVRYVIGISPFLDDAVKDEVYRRIVRFMLEDMPMSSSLGIYDAYHLRTITRIEVPGIRAFRSAKTRANQFQRQIHQLKAFLAARNERPDFDGFALDDAVRFPQFLDFVGENLAGAGDAPVVVVLGNPLYLDPKEPGFSMVDGYFPSDGHLTASREQSVFGLQGRTAALQGVVVHYGWFGHPWVNEIHRENIDRFWTLYLDRQGGKLATFCGDLPTVFHAVRSARDIPENPEHHYEFVPEKSKVEMLRIAREIGVADWITRDISPEPHQTPPRNTVGPMKIGIRWQTDVDLDLYARPSRACETLFFEHTRSPEGYYFKDHRSSPEREFEFIEFESPVDVWQAEASVNFYEGIARSGVEGEIRIEFDGRIYVGEFSLPSEHGNHGRAGSGQAAFWTSIDIPEILRLRRGSE